MIGRELIVWALGAVFVLGLAPLALSSVSFVSIAAAEDAVADAEEGAAASSPRSPIRVKVVDYAKADEGPGTLKMSGTAIAGNTVYIYVDDKPFAEVDASDGDGAWSAEDKIALEGGVHSVRVEQFDKATQILAGRAMFSISLTKPTAEDLANQPGGSP